METIAEPRSATLRRLWPLAWAHSTAVFRYRPRFARWLVVPFTAVIVPSIAGWIERGEFYVTSSTTVAMRRTVNRRPAILTATVSTVACLVAFPLIFIATYLQVFADNTSPVGIAFGLIAVLLLASALAATSKRLGWVRDDEHTAIRELSHDAPVVVLHDLARPDSDPAGTGTELLAGIIRHPDFAGTVIVATAATDELAGRYVRAGMTRFTPTSRTVYFRA